MGTTCSCPEYLQSNTIAQGGTEQKLEQQLKQIQNDAAIITSLNQQMQRLEILVIVLLVIIVIMVAAKIYERCKSGATRAIRQHAVAAAESAGRLSNA